MSKRVFKYELPSGNYEQTTEIELPAEAKILKVGSVNGKDLVMWAEHTDGQTSVELRTFIIAGTSVLISWDGGKRAKYVGTGITHKDFVWHVYEVTDY